jgi:Protein of unknown function (DUF3443)
MASMRALKMGLCAVLCLSAIACGGSNGTASNGGGTPPPPTNTANTVSVIIDEGPDPSTSESVNTLFTSVTVCVPGSTTNCQTIDHIQVDTGSYGLRLLASVLTLTLPVETLASGGSLAECTQFVDGFSWGSVATADIQIAGETAKSLPVQVIGDPNFTNIPAECSSTGGTQEDTVSTFGANGILGIGPFESDCGDCDTATHGLYFACTTSCTDTTVPDNLQVPNPVTHFAADNNGAIVVLPSVAAGGAANVMGSLIFGIDTQADNASGTQTVLTVDDDAELLMTFNGQTLANSFIDSGSNGIFFADSSIVTCTAPPSDPTSQIVNFYCPANTLTLPITIQGTNGTMTNNLTFDVGNAITMLNNPFDAYPQLAGTLPPGNAGTFDFGLPFFYGRRVAIAVQGAMTTVGTGPYIAF